ncbi:MAG: methionyl-tRNA formyltransferase [Firmicutes bacterium]|nr:methionyl-tRNA formyltransferase [Bacillota bacterium]
MRLVFMGTPEFAVPSLRALIDEGWDIAAVVTQPDRRRGRGHRVSYSPIKEVALEAGLPVMQPEKVSDPEFVGKLQQIGADAIVVVAFGQIIPPSIVHMPPHGCINVHASLLPKYRGASPIHKAIIDGCQETGITTMLIDEGCDTGCILLQEQVAIADCDTAGTLEEKLAPIGARLLVKTLAKLQRGELEPIPQDEEGACYAHKLKRETGEIDWSMSSSDIANLVRGLTPWPGAFTCHRGQLLKIWEIECTKNQTTKGPGMIVDIADDGLIVSAGGELVCLSVVQPPNRPRMAGRDYANGYHVVPGEVLGGPLA